MHLPERMMCPASSMVTVAAVKKSVHVVVAAGSCGMLREPSCVDVMKAPLGRRTRRPCPWCTAVTFTTGPLTMMKWAVAPVSTMTSLDCKVVAALDSRIKGGEGTEVCNKQSSILDFTIEFIFCVRPAVPLCYLGFLLLADQLLWTLPTCCSPWPHLGAH